MSKILTILACVIGAIIMLLVLFGGTELIATIFNVEDDDNKTLIRWGLIVGLLVIGSLFRRKYPSPK